jgi:putative ABC transport system permease protein
VLTDLETSLLRPFPVVTAEEVRANPAIRSATQTFDFLGALGAAAGLLVAAGTLLYLQARGRARAVSYELARRMGLGAGAHRLAATLELGWMLIGGAVLGALLAVGAARIAIPEVDAPVEIPAGPLVRIPWPLLALTLVALVAVAVAAGFYAHRVARRARIAEVLRAAD